MPSKKRGRPSRNLSVKSIIHIYTEGESEKNYFKSLKSNPSFRKKTNLSVKSYSKGKQGLNLLNVVKRELSKIKGEEKPDKVYIVFDKDNLPNEEIKDCIKQAADLQKISIGFSNPSFEVWLLSHFKPLTSFQSQEQLENELTKYLHKPYKKADNKQISAILEHLDEAHDNCSNYSKISDDNILKNPYTNLSLMIKDILS